MGGCPCTGGCPCNGGCPCIGGPPGVGGRPCCWGRGRNRSSLCWGGTCPDCGIAWAGGGLGLTGACTWGGWGRHGPGLFGPCEPGPFCADIDRPSSIGGKYRCFQVYGRTSTTGARRCVRPATPQPTDTSREGPSSADSNTVGCGLKGAQRLPRRGS